jgi:hypothetical protein
VIHSSEVNHERGVDTPPWLVFGNLRLNNNVGLFRSGFERSSSYGENDCRVEQERDLDADKGGWMIDELGRDELQLYL